MLYYLFCFRFLQINCLIYLHLYEKNLTHDFNWGKILPFQLEYAKEKKAKKVVFTTNSSIEGDFNSYRTNRIIEKTLAVSGLVKLIHKDVILYNAIQNVWEVTSYNNL